MKAQLEQQAAGKAAVEAEPSGPVTGLPTINDEVLQRVWSELTEEQQAFQADKMAVHAAMIDRMDEAIGQILAQLRSSGMLENTLILFASDNGASAEIMVRGDGHDRHASPG